MGTVTAPEPLMAKSAVCHSGQLGANKPTRSPGFTPSSTKALASPATRRRNSWEEMGSQPSERRTSCARETGARQWLVRSERGANRRSWARMNVPQGRTVAQYWQRARLRWQEILDPWRLSDISD